MEENKRESMVSKEPISKIIIKFTLPFILGFEFSLILYLLFPEQISDFAEVFVFVYFNPAGIEIGILWALVKTDLNIFQIVGFILVIDSLTAMFLIWNFDLTKAIPGISRLVLWVEERTEKRVKKSKRFDKGRFWGLIIFVMIPAYGTGAILGGIVGKLLRMDPWNHFLAIFIGSSLRITVMAIAFKIIMDYLGIGI